MHETNAVNKATSPTLPKDAALAGAQKSVDPSAKTKGKAHGQTGPKSEAGKKRSRWNALKDGATAKSTVLPFEDARLYKRHIKEVEEALAPSNYVEQLLVREYAEGVWRIIRHEKRSAYERERIFKDLTAPMVANMLGLEERYVSGAPDYLMDLKYHISQKEAVLAGQALLQYRHLMENAQHIGNFNMVWRQYPVLFEALSQWLLAKNPNSTPLFTSTGKDLNLPWQQNPTKFVQLLERFSDHLLYVAYFDSMKPKIRVWMESWYFLQRSEMRKLESVDQLLLKERNQAHAILDRLARLRKSTLFAIPTSGHALRER